MPRDWASNTLFQAWQGTHARGVLKLEIDVPSAGTVTVSDSDLIGRNIVLTWGVIEPLLSEEETAPEAQGFDVLLSNVEAGGERIADTLNVTGIEGAEARLYAVDTGPTGTLPWKTQLLFRGKVQAVGPVTASTCGLRIDGRGAYFARALDHLVSADWPQAPADHAGRLQPLVYGAVPAYLPVPVDVGIIGELDAVLAIGATSLTLKDDVSRWPSSGTGQLGGSELFSWSGKNTDDRTLTGLTRGLYGTKDGLHAEGTLCFERPTAFEFLVADPSYGGTKRVRKVRVGGREVATSQWSYDDAENVLTIQPYARSLGHPTYNHVQMINRGLRHPGQPTAMMSNQSDASTRMHATAMRHISDNLQSRPITNCAHGALIPWGAPASTHYWPSRTDVTPASGDKANCTSTVTLAANTPKTWAGSYFSSYTPPSGIFIRTGVTIVVMAMPALRRAYLVGSAWELKTEVTKLQRIDCTVGGVTKSWYPSGDDAFSNPQFTLNSSQMGAGRPVPIQYLEFAFSSDEIDPDGDPQDVTLEAVTGSGVSSHVCRIQSLVYSIDGVLPWTAPTGFDQATLSQESPSNSEIVATFPTAREYAVLAVSCRAACDYIRVDLGGGRYVRFQPTAIDDSTMHYQDVTDPGGAWMTFTVVVQNPSLTIKIQARDFGRDDQAPASGSASQPHIHVGAATLFGLTSGSATFPLLKDVKADSVFLASFGEYPEIDVEGYVNAADTLLEHPCDVVEHYLTEVMGEAAADVDVDANRSDWSSSLYKFAGCILEPEDIRLPLVRMARESRAWIEWDRIAGHWRMVFRKSPAQIAATSADFTWDPGQWISGEPVLERTYDKDLLTKVNVRFARDWRKPDTLDAYAAVASSGSGSRTSDDRYVCHFVRSKALADTLAAFHAAWDTVSTRTTSLAVLISELDCMKGDIVSLSIPNPGSDPLTYLQGVEDRKFVITGVGFAPYDLSSSQPPTVLVLLKESPT